MELDDRIGKIGYAIYHIGVFPLPESSSESTFGHHRLLGAVSTSPAISIFSRINKNACDTPEIMRRHLVNFLLWEDTQLP